LTITNSSFSGNDNAVEAHENVRGAITDTVFAGNVVGPAARTAGDYMAPDVNLERCTISQNFVGVVAGIGFAGQINRGVVRIAHNLITGNSTGVLEYSDGKIMTMTSAAW